MNCLTEGIDLKNRYLSIRLNAILHLTLMFILIIGLVFLALRFYAFRQAQELDEHHALLHVQRISDGLSFTTAAMKQTVTDWGKWDETYDFLMGTHPEYIQDNLNPEAQESIDIDMVLIYDVTGNLFYHQVVDFGSGTTSGIGLPLINAIESLNFISNINPHFQLSGLLSFDQQLMILVTSPIMRGNYSGDVIGNLVFIRLVDQELIETLENMVMPFEIIPNDGLTLSSPTEITIIDSSQMSVKRLIVDLNGNFDLMIHITLTMETSVIISEVIQRSLLSIALILLVFLLIIVWMLDRQMFKRLHLLADNIKDLEQHNDIHLRVDIDRKKDEITYIGNSINQMLNKLEISYQEINQLAYLDHLTGVQNRLSFYQSIESYILAKDHEFSLLFIDLDGFKSINDTLGHETGDFVLIEVAKRILSIIGSKGIIARAGGDEFLIYLPFNDVKTISDICQAIIDALANELIIDQHHINTTASIGIARYPQSGTTLKQLIKKSDIAMYHAKTSGKNQYFFDE
jgi:diguanylate cyclase (GGDEF)-like protein